LFSCSYRRAEASGGNESVHLLPRWKFLYKQQRAEWNCTRLKLVRWPHVCRCAPSKHSRWAAAVVVRCS
jgi:hypothetical protein